MAIVPIQPYDPNANTPPVDVIRAVEAGLSIQTRRLEIYEADAITRWYPDPNDPSESRLTGGTVNVDYGSDERRKLDATLYNADKLLRPNPNGGFWYDKVLKIFAGVEFDPRDVEPHLAVIESEGNTTANGLTITSLLAGAGFRDNALLLGVSDVSPLREYSWIVSGKLTTATAVSAQLKTLWAMGKNIITFGVANGAAQVPHYSAFNASASVLHGIANPPQDAPTTPVFAGGVSESEGTATAATASTAAAGVVPLAVWTNGASPTFITAAMARNPNGAFWLDIRLPALTGSLARKFLKTILAYARNYYGTRTWEAQMGEFYIDNIGQANFPEELKVTCRDATKKMINSKLSRNAIFVVGTSLNDFVIGQAALAGIPVSKMRFSMAEETLSTELAFDKGTSRWDMVKSALSSFNYEFFFDGTGNFVIRPFRDPSTSSIDFSFLTGPVGNLVTFEKAVNDSRIYNIVQVTSDPTDTDANPVGYFGEARNDDPNSPTNTTRLGERVQPIDAPWLTSNEACAALAADYLKIAALESYEINFSSIYYSWLECGTIVEILDPDAYSFEPTRFLMDTLDYTLDLGPMNATGKRITFIGSSGDPL